MIDLSLRDRARDRPVAETVRRPYVTSTLSCELALQLIQDNFLLRPKLAEGNARVRYERTAAKTGHSTRSGRCAARWRDDD